MFSYIISQRTKYLIVYGSKAAVINFIIYIKTIKIAYIDEILNYFVMLDTNDDI